MSPSLRSQTFCTNFQFLVDFDHYAVDENTHDTTFVKYFQFDINDTVNVSKINYTLSVVNNGTQVQLQDFDFKTTSSSLDMTKANGYMRNKKNMKVSFGQFKYQDKNYVINIKLYDNQNTLLGSTTFNFSH
ncbi:MAG: hypothetical protein ACXVPV_09990 [Bacteroidia bacterium]